MLGGYGQLGIGVLNEMLNDTEPVNAQVRMSAHAVPILSIFPSVLRLVAPRGFVLSWLLTGSFASVARVRGQVAPHG